MKVFVASVAAGVVCALLAYGMIRLLLPELAASELTNLIGMVAVVGAVVSAWVARRLDHRRDGESNGF